MKGHILVEVEVLLVTIIGESLELGHNGTPRGRDSVATEEDSMQNSSNLSSILALDLLHVSPPA